MKTTLTAIATILFMVLGFANIASANTAKTDAGIILTDISKINKIEVYGNVELYISSGPADQVKVYNRYYSENALVQSQKGVLRISSYKAEKLVVWITANQLSAINAYDNAEIKSFGCLSGIELDVKLNNNASANLNLDTYSASITLSGNAKAELKGNTNEYSLTRNATSNVNSNGLAYAHATETLNKETRPRANDFATL
ncbi:GIN domain-containing protein [Mucilaginibacter sp. Mucisp84]|uniref:GIN domain-containing protein n=1 Tax=Mucilaginibacter sp. Mucisp84 TaxID=3243058 RepID=UPI0039A5DA64